MAPPAGSDSRAPSRDAQATPPDKHSQALSMRGFLGAIQVFLILRSAQRARLEGRTTVLQPCLDSSHALLPAGRWPLQPSKPKLTISDRCEEFVDYALRYLGQRRRAPLRLAVAVDQHRADAFVKIVPGHNVLGHPVLEGERRIEVELPTDRQLAQCDLEAGRGFGQQAGARLL